MGWDPLKDEGAGVLGHPWLRGTSAVWPASPVRSGAAGHRGPCGIRGSQSKSWLSLQLSPPLACHAAVWVMRSCEWLLLGAKRKGKK